MTTLTAQLGRRSANHNKAAAAASLLSLESDIVDLVDESNTAIDEVSEVSTQITTASDDIVSSTTGVGSLSDLVDNTVDIYGETGIPEDAAKQLEVSVEAILRVMGHPGGFSTILPSMEACATPTQYSTEAEEKKNGVVSRIWEWIQKIFGQLVDFVSGLVDKMRNSTESLSKLTAKLKEKVSALEGEEATGDVSLGGYGKFCSPTSASETLTGTGTSFKAFVTKWEGYFGTLFTNELSKKSLKDPATAGATFTAMMEAEAKKLPEWKNVKVTSFHSLEITPGSNAENPLIGAKASVKIDGENKQSKCPALTKAKMLEVLNATAALLEEVAATAKDFDKYKTNLGHLKSTGLLTRVNSAAVGINPNNGPLVRQMAKKMGVTGQVFQSLARIGIDGLGQSVPAVLDIIRANLTYVNKSAAAHGKAKPAEKATA